MKSSGFRVAVVNRVGLERGRWRVFGEKKGRKTENERERERDDYY